LPSLAKGLRDVGPGLVFGNPPWSPFGKGEDKLKGWVVKIGNPPRSPFGKGEDKLLGWVVKVGNPPRSSLERGKIKTVAVGKGEGDVCRLDASLWQREVGRDWFKREMPCRPWRRL